MNRLSNNPRIAVHSDERPAPPAGFRRERDGTGPGSISGAAYAELRRVIVAAGLLDRAYGYYLARGGLCFALLIVAVVLPFGLPSAGSGWLLAAVSIGVAVVQVALLGHDAGHRAVFRSPQANWALGMLCWSLTLGIGFWYWRDRHNRHHAHTNDPESDPDVLSGGLVAFTEDDAAGQRGWRRVFVRHQAFLAPLGMLLVGFIFRVDSWRFTARCLSGGRRALEAALLSLNMLLWAAVIAALGWQGVGVFVGSQIVGGFYFSLVSAPNHKGMPIWAEGASLPFLEQQVLSSRNVTAHPVWDFVFGGLNYQIEHHLFPTMPRVNFSRARLLVKSFCAAHDLPYEEVDPFTSYKLVFAELRRVGRAAVG